MCGLLCCKLVNTRSLYYRNCLYYDASVSMFRIRSVMSSSRQLRTCCFNACFRGKRRSPVPARFSSCTCSGKETFGTSGTAGCPSCHPSSSVKALKETQSTDPSQWPGLFYQTPEERVVAAFSWALQ